jgi:hypothetical protein
MNKKISQQASYSSFRLQLGKGITNSVTSQDFVKFWGTNFAFVLLEMIEISQGFKTLESI